LGVRQIVPGNVPDNLVLWLKADAGTTGSPTVTAWDDQSPNGYNTTASGDPQLVSSAINYNPGIDFDAAGDYFQTTATSIIGADNPYTKFGVVITDNDAAGQIIMGAAGEEHDMRFTAGAKLSSRHRSGATIRNWGLSSNSIVAGQAHLVGLRYDGLGGLNDQSMLDGSETVASDMDRLFDDTGPIDIGSRNSGTTLFDGYISEAIIYTEAVSDADIVKIESYLAIKYGITLDNSGGGTDGDLVATDGTTIWDADVNPGFHNELVVIGRDDNEALYQKQSRTADDTLNLYIDALAADNSSNTGTISNNVSYLVIGHNGGTLQGQRSEKPASVFSRFNREWKVTNTNFTDSYSIEFEWDEEGAFDISHIRLLVDTDDDFTDATVYGPADGLTFTVGSIIVGGIGTAHIPANTTMYITVASAHVSTPLPIELVSFNTITTDNQDVQLDWQTASETNNDYFTIERSQDGKNWVEVKTVDGAGDSSKPISYSEVDTEPFDGISYYRLKQTDFDGTFTYSQIKSVNIDKLQESRVIIFPNPTSDRFTMEGEEEELKQIAIYDMFGHLMSGSYRVVERRTTTLIIDVSKLADGIYMVKTKNFVTKVVKE
jgi:hypothetical protein